METVKQRYKRIHDARLLIYRMSSGCETCGFGKDDPHTSRVLQFHHRYGPKDFKVTSGTRWGRTRYKANKNARANLLIEIRKCVVLCPTCHALEHLSEDTNGT